MAEIFDVTGDDIKKLRDDELRELIGKLLIADYRAANLGVTGITWGGNQDAADGGLDVVVRNDIDPPAYCYAPRKHTGFQVKKPAMGPAEILKEMKPEGILRDSIKALIAQGGAYIIVSSGASTTDLALTNRKIAMRSAVSDVDGHENFHLDFYDCGRIATWVHSHTSLMLWVQAKIGRPLQGWQPYGNWSASPNGLNDTYLLDDGLRLYGAAEIGDFGEKAIDAIQYLRGRLLRPKACLRLVGLSGVGKTRFVQALFEEQVGDNPLNPFWAVYTNISDSPSPDPVAFANRLMTDRTDAILIVDNCPPNLHKRLVDVCSGNNSKLRLLSIEYDVQDDLPEETEVLRLEPASEELIFLLIDRRFPHISQVDARTIANFSGGNARVAIALASTVEQGKTLGLLKDQDLFKRLFDQTNDPSERLLHHAEIVSLVYSFDGADTESVKSELAALASIVTSQVDLLFRSVSELQNRQLVQARGVWRAVLPHAIANRLAAQALIAIPKERILNVFMAEGRERLLRSFTRRLGFLHDSAQARKIANGWLAPTGWLGQTGGNLTDLEIAVLNNIAPVVPESVLALIEYWANVPDSDRFVLREYRAYSGYISLLRHIAYDVTLFSRCVELSCRFLLAEEPNERNSITRDTLKSLFYVKFSGTLAPAETRALIIRSLWDSKSEAKQNLALVLLDATYEAFHFSHSYDYSFGARPRDLGWYPKTSEDVAHWYGTFISLGLEFVRSDVSKLTATKKLLANSFRGMWTSAQVYGELDAMCDQLLQLGAWNEGWIAVREVINYDKDDLNAEAMLRLRQIEQKLKPADLLETARAFALSDAYFIYGLTEGEQDDSSRDQHQVVQNFVKKLGRKVIEDAKLFAVMLPSLVTANSHRLWSFGEGLAEGAPDKMKLWSNFRAAYENIAGDCIQVRCLMGVLSSPSMETVVEEIMDMLVEDPILGDQYPFIQTAVDITDKALTRLHISLDIGKIPIAKYGHLAWSYSLKTLTEEQISSLLQKILARKNGLPVACEILNRRIDINIPIQSESLIEIGQNILLNFPDNRKQLGNRGSDFYMAELANMCMVGDKAQNAAIALCQTLADAICKYQLHAIDCSRLFSKMAELHPRIFLDTFLSPPLANSERFRRVFPHEFHHGENPLDRIQESDIISWCEVDPVSRYPLIASSMTYFKPKPASNAASEVIAFMWNPLVYRLLEEGPNVLEILNVLGMNFKPQSYRDSLADAMAQRVEVLQELFTHPNSLVVSWALEKHRSVSQFIQEQREREKRASIMQNETFE